MATATLGLPELESELIPASELESEFEAEFEGESEMELESEFELSPIRRIYPDAMMEHMAHAAMEAESEQEAAEQFLPLIPMVAGKLLPLAAKALPKIAGKVLPRVLPRVARVVSRVTPQLTRGISTVTRTLFRNRQTRPLVRAVPSIARRTVAQIARQTAAGRPVTPQTAIRVLRYQTRRVIGTPQQRAIVLRRSAALDRRFHTMAGIPWRPSVATHAPSVCPRCNYHFTQTTPVTCRCCGQLITR